VTTVALNDSPQFVNRAWEWTATVPVQQTSIDFTLFGTPSGSTINWRMEISGSDPVTGVTYDAFILYTAQTTVGEQGGTWKQFYDLEGIRANVLDATTGEGSIESTTINSGVKGCWDANQDDIAC